MLSLFCVEVNTFRDIIHALSKCNFVQFKTPLHVWNVFVLRLHIDINGSKWQVKCWKSTSVACCQLASLFSSGVLWNKNFKKNIFGSFQNKIVESKYKYLFWKLTERVSEYTFWFFFGIPSSKHILTTSLFTFQLDSRTRILKNSYVKIPT